MPERPPQDRGSTQARGSRAWIPALAILLSLTWSLSSPAGAAPALLNDDAEASAPLPDGWTLAARERAPDHLRLRFERSDGSALRLTLFRRGDIARPYRRVGRFDLVHEGRLDGGDARAHALLDWLCAQIDATDDGRLVLEARAGPAAEGRPASASRSIGLAAQIRLMSGLDRAQVLLSLLLLLVALPFLALAVADALRRLLAQDDRARGWTLAGLGLGVLLRLIAPARLVMIYMGYRMTQTVADFASVPKYGAATFSLYRLSFGLLGPDHATLVAVNTIAGLLSLPLAAGLLRRAQAGGWPTAAATWFLACVPLFIQDHRSESLLVPTTLFLLGALTLWDLALTERRSGALVGAAALAALAITSRPALALITPVALGAWWWARAGSRDLPPGRWLFAAGVGAAAAVIPHLVHLLSATTQQQAAGALPQLTEGLGGRVAYGLLFRNALFDPQFFGPVITALGLAAPLLAAPRQRRLALALLAIAFAWIAPSYVDLPTTSIPRLHAPAALLVSLAAALAIGGTEPRARRLLGRRARALPVVALLLALASCLPSVPSLWGRTNEDEEARLLDRARAALPDRPACLVRLDERDDPTPGKTHRYTPDYWFAPPHRDDQVLGIRAFEDGQAGACPGGRYFFLGLRCYTRYDGRHAQAVQRVVTPGWTLDPRGVSVSYVRPGMPEPDLPPMLRACRRMLEARALEPVFEEEIVNHGDNEFGYYPPVASFKVGLYRIGE
jgi:hypothetical protein